MRYAILSGSAEGPEHELLEAYYPSLIHASFGYEDCVKISSPLFISHAFDLLDTEFPMGFSGVYLWKWYFVPKRMIVEAFQCIFKKTTCRAIYSKLKNESVYTEFKIYTDEWHIHGFDVAEYYKKYTSIDPVLRVKFK